jgi:hypothetical protein
MESRENPCGGNEVVPCGRAGRQAGGRTDGRTDAHEGAKIRFSQFCEHARKVFWLGHFCDQIQAKL